MATSNVTDPYATGPWAAALAAMLFLTALSTVSCGAQKDVNLTGAWPQEDAIAMDAPREWRRVGVLRAPAETAFAEYLELYAMPLSPAVRAAMAKRSAEVRGYSAEETSALLAKERGETARDIEIMVFATTYHQRHNDFASPTSVWKLELILNDTEVIAAASITRDRRPKPTIVTEYPWTGDFAEVYRVTFPKNLPWDSSLEDIKLRASSTLGHVTLNWHQQP